jgi:D-beta-D-heptose 7-phosphate kinase/D-beta-D-heptose 1-phosphate adenosyltransferase
MIDDLLERIASARVVVIGDVMLDRYLWGDVKRISPEAPVPVVDVRRQSNVPGGAGNAAGGVAALGAHAELCSVIGDDDDGSRLLGALAESSVACSGVIVVEGRKTTTKTRVVAHSQQVVRTDVEERADLSADLERQLIEWAAIEIRTAGAVVLSDYAKGVVTERLARSVIDVARAQGCPVVVDPKGRDYSKYRGATVLTPNTHDAELAAHATIDSYQQLLDVGRRLVASLDGAHLLLTRGSEGMTLIGAGDSLDIDAEARAVYDVTGAGDTVVAVLAAALASGAGLEQAIRLANSAAGIAVGKVGTTAVTAAELRDA